MSNGQYTPLSPLRQEVLQTHPKTHRLLLLRPLSHRSRMERKTAQMASKGSVAVDGVSLTLVRCDRDMFSVALIPYTLRVTTLGQCRVGDTVNIETDILAKYVQRLIEAKEWT